MKNLVIFVILLSSTIACFAVDSLNVTRVGYYNTEAVARDAVVVGSRAYIADAYSGVVVVDVTDPTFPTFISAFDTPGEASALSIYGTLLYEADMSGGIRLFSLANPSYPMQISRDTIYATYTDVAGRGNYAFCCLGWSGFTVIDFSDLLYPEEYGHIPSLGGYVYSISIDNDRAYLACGAGGMQIIDISDPIAPVVIGSYATTGSARGIYARRDTAFIATNDNGLVIVDALDPSSPVLIGNLDTDGYAYGIWVEDSLAFIADYDEGIRVINIYNPTAPFETGYYSDIHNCLGVTVANGYIYASFGNDGLYILDGGLQLNAPLVIDSAWMWEETVCDGHNTIYINYLLSDPEGDSTAVFAQMSDDSGLTWDVPFNTLNDTSGNLGTGIAPGEHSFRWSMGTDMPNTEGLPFVVEISTVTPQISNLYVPGTACPFWAGMPYGTQITDWWGGDTIPTVSAVRVEIDAMVDSVVIAASGSVSFGVSEPFYGPSGGSATTPIGDYRDTSGISYVIDAPIIGLMAVFIGPGRPDTAALPPDIWAPTSTPELQQSVYIGAGPTTLIPPEGATRLFLGVNDNYRWQDNLGGFDTVVKIYNDNSISFARAMDYLDSKDPVLSIDCPTETLIVGTDYEFVWHVGDYSPLRSAMHYSFATWDTSEYYETWDTTATWRVSEFFAPQCTLYVWADDSFCNQSDKFCLLDIEEAMLPCTAWVDTAWFVEETDCDGRNVVEICYVLMSSCPDSIFYVTARYSPDSGETWIVDFDSVYNEENDLGYVLPGTHCFYWEFGDDYPNTEGEDWLVEFGVSVGFDTFIVIDSFDVSSRPNYGRGLAYGEGYYYIYDSDEGWVYQTSCIGCSAVDSFWAGTENNCDIDYEDGYIYYADSTGGDCKRVRRINVATGANQIVSWLPEYASDIEGVQVVGDSLIVAWYGILPAEPNMLLYLDLTDTYPITSWDTILVSYAETCATIEGLTFAHGHLWGSNDFGRIVEIDLEIPDYVGCHPVPNIGEGAEGLCYDGEYMWYHNFHGTGTMQIYKIQLWDSFVNSYTVSGPLDSRGPNIAIDCPSDSIPIGETYEIEWVIDDISWGAEPCSVHIYGCGEERHNYIFGNSLDWTDPWECEACTIRVVTKDTFCNWGVDTCVVKTFDEEPPCSVFIDSVWFIEEIDCDDRNIVEICYQFSSNCPDSGYYTTVLASSNGGTSWAVSLDSAFEYTGDIGAGTLPGLHCFYWEAGHDFPGWSGDSFAIRVDVAGFGDSDYMIATGIIDTKRPIVTIDCPSNTLLPLVPYVYHWSLTDDYIGDNPCSLTIQGCGIYERREVSGTSFGWTAPWACSTFTMVVAAKDSFCNWSADTCRFTIQGEEVPCSAWVDTAYFSQETDCNDSSIVTVCYDLVYTCPESLKGVAIIGSDDGGESWDVALATLYNSTGDIGDSIVTGEHCFDWNVGRDMPNWESVDFGIRVELYKIGSGITIDHFDTYGPVDSKNPTITLDCAESALEVGDTAVWSWTVDDLFPVEDYYEIALDWCAGETTLVLDSAAFEWVVPTEAAGCDELSFIIAGRDSFCNWGADTCISKVDTIETPELRCHILIYSNAGEGATYGIGQFDSLIAVLESMGNIVEAYGAGEIAFTSTTLDSFNQLWFIDSKNSLETTLLSAEIAAISAFVADGNGLALLADHHPYYTQDANFLLDSFDANIAGSANHRLATLCNDSIDFEPHSVTSGISALACFTSEGRIQYSGTGDFEPLALFDGDTLQAGLIDGGRVFIDGSFYRYINSYVDDCDDAALIENISCWLEPNGCGCEAESCALEVVAAAGDSELCAGYYAELSATATGATGAVSYEWWSSPSGFTSTLRTPNFGPLYEDILFIVQATDELGCESLDTVLIEVLDDETIDTFMCLGDTMTFCESPVCDTLMLPTRAGSAITVTRDGLPALGCLMEADSACMDFIPFFAGDYIVCQDNYYDRENGCCYHVCWHVTVCCKPYGTISADSTGPCEWSIEFEIDPDSGCGEYDGIDWEVTSFFDLPFDTTIFGEALDIALSGSDSVEICAVPLNGCIPGMSCTFRACTTLTCGNADCCTLMINALTDTICMGDEAYLCAYFVGADCPDIDSLPGQWTLDGVAVGNDFCLTHSPDSTTEYCYHATYTNSLGAICAFNECASVAVVPQPEGNLWPSDTIISLGSTIELPIPCGEFGGGFMPDSIVALSFEGGHLADTVGVYSPGDWCVLHRTMTEAGAEVVFCYDFYIAGCEWLSLECCTVSVCDTPSAEITTPIGICAEEGVATVCIHNLNTAVHIDRITWSTGATTTCTDIPIDVIETSCGGANSFEPETVWAEICHECDGNYSCIVETLVVEPTHTFWIDLLPPGVTQGDSIDTEPHIVPPPASSADSLIDWFICDDTLIYRGTSRYPDGIHGATSLYEKTIYCAQFEFDYDGERCVLTACDSVFVQDSLLTLIKSPCATDDPGGFLDADGYRRYGECEFTFPIDGDCITICASDTDFAMPTAYMFDHWETSTGIYSYASCTTYCPTGAFDTLIAVYDTASISLAIAPDSEGIAITIEEVLQPEDSVFTENNLIEPRRFMLTNTGGVALDMQIRWVSATNQSGYDCPAITLTNDPIPGVNTIGLRGAMTADDSTSTAFEIIRNTFARLSTPGTIPTGNARNLFIGVVSPPGYHRCYPGEVDIEYRITLRLRWGVALP